MWYDTFDDLEGEEIERIVTLPTAAATTAKVTFYVPPNILYVLCAAEVHYMPLATYTCFCAATAKVPH